MQENVIWIVFGIIIGLIIGYLFAKVYFHIRVKQLRKQSVDKSRQVMTGHVNEQMAPLLPHFPYAFKDAMFLGKGVDYVIFEGLSQGLIRHITFLEIKTGQSQLNKNERMIKSCVDQGAVSYAIWRK